MPGFVLHAGAAVQCVHGGAAQPTAPYARVQVSGQAVVLQPAPYIITGCPFNVGGSPSPCLTAQWTSASTRLQASGMAVLLLDSQATCAPNGTPLLILSTQTRVLGG
ncbi:hypothetical protein ACW9KT_19695 [Hymenobacter sp. HD11105]